MSEILLTFSLRNRYAPRSHQQSLIITDTNQLTHEAENTAIAAQTMYDQNTDSITEELIHTIAEVRESDPSELDALGYTIDPDALNALFSPRENGMARNGTCSVEFSYEGYLIQISNDSTITFRTLT